MSEEKMREELVEILRPASWLNPKAEYVDSVMAWAQRWGGRPSVDQIKTILRKEANISHKECIQDDFANCELFRGISTLYPTPSPRVSREQIENWYRQPHDGTVNFRERMIDDLCRLIGIPEERPKVSWCVHCVDGWCRRKLPDGGTANTAYSNDWKVCPICSAPRPAARGVE